MRKIIISFVILIAIIAPLSFGEGIDLTEDELAFIEEHPVITLGVDPAFIPFEFIDVDGEYKGIANEYIKIIETMTGLRMEVVEDLTWSEAFEGAVEGSIDVLPCVSKTEERENYFIFSEPYYHFQRVIMMNKNDNSISDYRELVGKEVAVQKNSSHHSYLQGYDGITMNLYNTPEDALLAVANGKESYFIGNLATSSYLISSLGLSEMKYIVFESETKNGLHFAVRSDWPELQSILNKSLALITDEDKIGIHNRWVRVKEEVDYSNIIRAVVVVTCLILIIISVSFFWIVRLRKEIKKRIIIEEDLKIAKYEAELANEIKSNFLARMSHEIRTPLNAIIGLSYLIKDTDLSILQKSHIEKISHSATTMLSIINDILDFSKIEAGKLEIENESFELDEVIRNVVNIVSLKVVEQELHFTLVKDPNLPNNYFGDSTRISQVLLNLLNNALKFTEKGEVALSVNLVGFQRDEYEIEFKIKDTGIGMSEDHLEKLFEPFTQEDASISRRFGGTGLGLSIVKNLSDMMGGTLEVKSTLSKGTEFIFSIKLEVDLEREKEIKKGFEYIKDIKTLILNKDMSNLSLMVEYLRSFSIEAEFTSSTEQFINIIEKTEEKFLKPYDLVIIDDATPKEGASEFLKTLYMSQNISSIPKAILILPFMKEIKMSDFNENVVSIVKPILPSILYNAIVKLFTLKVMASQMSNTNNFPVNSFENIDEVTILIVEDNKTNQLIAKSLLEQIGFKVVIADNGQIAVDLFKADNEYKLILMDLHMPVLNGYEATSQIRQLDESIPIVAMTADAVDGVKSKCLEIGMNHFISKPFDPERFITQIKSILKEEMDLEEELIYDKSMGLKLMGNNSELLEQVLAVFIEENKNTSKNLISTISDGDYETAIQIVHKIKSSSGSIGSNKVRSIAIELQSALEDNRIDDINELSRTFTKKLDLLLEMLIQ